MNDNPGSPDNLFSMMNDNPMKRKLDIPSKLMTESPQEAEKDLIEIKKENALQAFETGEGLDDIIERARKAVADFEHDISTVAGRKRSASLAYKVARLKVRLDNLRKDIVSEKKTLINKVDKNGRYLRDELDKVKKEARKALDEWEEAEEARITRHQDNLLAIIAIAPSGQDDSPKMTLKELEDALDHASHMDIDDSWEEFVEKAADARQRVVDELLQRILLTRSKLEIEMLRQEKEERERKEEEDRAERERIENEKRLALEEKKRIEAAKKEAAELAAKLEREKQLAKFREEKEIAAQKRKDEIAKAEEALRRKQQEKEEADKKAKEAKEEAERANFERMKSEAAAESRAELAAKQAVLEEQLRVAEQRARDEAKREIDEAKWRRKREEKEHVLRIDGEVRVSMQDALDPFFQTDHEMLDKVVFAVFEAIKAGKVKHVTVKY